MAFVPGTGRFHFSTCVHCVADSLWFYPQQQPIPPHIKSAPPPLVTLLAERNKARLIFPSTGQGSLPSTDLPPEVRADYQEARSIAAVSPRGAAALLRLCIQKLCIHLGESGADLNAAIGKLVARGLPTKVQQALDTVRVIGNNAVHPGEIDLKDDLPTVLHLLDLVNVIADVMIGQPARIEALYDRSLTPGQKAQIASRDGSGGASP